MSNRSREKAKEWIDSIPDGLHPTFRYPDGSEENKVPNVGEVLWYNPKNAEYRTKNPAMYKASQLRGDLIFRADMGNFPKLPLRAYGEAWHTGWDIPTQWAIDANGTCWKDGAHGGAMHITTKEQLISEFESEQERNYVRKHMGLPEEEPSWMAAARAAGWTPPK